MPNSLKCKIKHLCHNGTITERDRDRILKALEQESILDKIRAEIMDFEEELFHRPNTDYTDYAAVRHCVEIIDKYKAEGEDKAGEEE